MSWRCSSTTNEGLVNNLWKHGLLRTPRIREAMVEVDRAQFTREMPYEDSPQRIGYDATISAPHIHANALETLKEYIKPGSNVLDIGSGSGYLCAVMAHLVAPNGKVTGIDHIPQITSLSIANLRKNPVTSEMLDSGLISIVTGDGRLGYPPNAPYDAIHVGAAAMDVHQPLLEQLKSPGRMFIPVAEGASMYGGQAVWQIDKDEKGNVSRKRLYGVMYVPLTDAKKFED
ncbi:protein-L-isoaspartate O-methyltransferas-like protein [Terfezia claveryi]|nr:protein-L-isoaspartate O-methyltransferas-like protein [Terfezia claveryi]